MPTLEERVTRAEQIISNLSSRLNALTLQLQAAELSLAKAIRTAANAAANSEYNQQSIKRMRRRLRG